MNKFLIFLIKIYQIFLKPLLAAFGLKTNCFFYPSCSDYAKIAFSKNKLPKALFLTAKRICRCHPWQKPQIDLIK